MEKKENNSSISAKYLLSLSLEESMAIFETLSEEVGVDIAVELGGSRLSREENLPENEQSLKRKKLYNKIYDTYPERLKEKIIVLILIANPLPNVTVLSGKLLENPTDLKDVSMINPEQLN